MNESLKNTLNTTVDIAQPRDVFYWILLMFYSRFSVIISYMGKAMPASIERQENQGGKSELWGRVEGY